jgi:light-regulated signal transduction histidine kinase (bacteriophytochrome)
MSTVDLSNCADEPIHIPGHIQPHGALLAFDLSGKLAEWSANAAGLLGFEPKMGTHFASLPLASQVKVLLDESCATADEDGGAPCVAEITIAGLHYDCVVHGNQQRIIAEFESCVLSNDAVAGFALKAHAGIDRLKRQKSINSLLALAVEQVRAITGFDRVMAYRFRQDDSGDVCAEARRDDLPPFLGMRYPASDIPAQARRLYTINTLRLIADIGYTPVPILGAAGQPPLDMSHCVLRSVSPIHLEYLRNMGIAASMSVSIVINGRLWGLIACHHMQPMQVPYSLRMACDVIAQVLAATIQSFIAREQAMLADQSAAIRTRLIETFLHEEDVIAALAQHAEELASVLAADALIFSQQGKLAVHGDLPQDLARAIVAAAPITGGEIVQYIQRSDWPADLQPVLGTWVGLLGLHFDPATSGWLLAMRKEQVETIRWGGKPEKLEVTGPLGHRLTPRGSFDEWLETVRDTAEPLDPTRLLAAQQLLAEMHRASMSRHAELERARMQLLAILGHDLRDPLHTISMAASVMQQGAQQPQLVQRIERSSGRMQRLISQVLDISRLDSGLGLGMQIANVNLSQAVQDVIEEARLAHPAVVCIAHIAPDLIIQGDADRMAQVLGNLLSNARHHGTAGFPVEVALREEGADVILEVSNRAGPIPPEEVAQLFNPFKRSGLQSRSNRTGLGLGLYIAANIIQGHQGELSYHYDDPSVVFRVTLPIGSPQ